MIIQHGKEKVKIGDINPKRGIKHGTRAKNREVCFPDTDSRQWQGGKVE